MVGDAKVTARSVPHVGPTNGYRIEWDGAHRSPTSPITSSLPTVVTSIADGALELCDGADLVIHDAQYTVPEFAMKSTWGHCTVEYAVLVAKEAGAKSLALVPSRPDPSRRGARRAVRVRCASYADQCRHRAASPPPEGLTVSFG